MANKNILLVEPGYRNKYPPLGLMKIAQYHGPRGKGDKVRFIKGEDNSVFAEAWDRVYITTLFSFEYRKTAQAIDFALEVVNGQADKVFVGGIAASLMNDRFCSEQRWQGVRFIKGLLSAPPAVALQLDEFTEELYSDDTNGGPIEDLVPDYGILDQVDYRYPVHDAYFAYTSRGCIRKCRFCGVPTLEGPQRDTETLSRLVTSIEKLYGPKKDLILMDNNVVASARFKEIIAEIRDLGFVPGAKLARGRTTVQRRVDFNQGVDARILCKDPMYLRELATICIKPLRIAFDHLGVRKPYEQAVRYAAAHGLTELSNYMLYNFHDSPADLFARMRLNVALNEDLGIRIWSFPMRYQPTDRPDRGHIGAKWSRYQLRSMQLILQATHGIVSGAPSFFRRAFGDTCEDFERILLLPHDYIFNRGWFEQKDPMQRLAAFEAAFATLTSDEKVELVELLSSCGPKHFVSLQGKATTKRLRRILPFYVPVPKSELFAIWEGQKRLAPRQPTFVNSLAEDERVEDAGLEERDELHIKMKVTHSRMERAAT
ncbi:MAG: radical SAM protein [Chloroflexota bacterium]|nr:radical SAM protein [Chloroflexota bacterium]